MPISPEKMKRYPGGSTRSPEWLAFRASLIERAGNACEGTPQNPDCRAANGEPHPKTGGRVVLTIAHMDWDETHADPERCRALCQRCHNQWDAPMRQINASKTRKRRIGQDDMFSENEDRMLCRANWVPSDLVVGGVYQSKYAGYWKYKGANIEEAHGNERRLMLIFSSEIGARAVKPENLNEFLAPLSSVGSGRNLADATKKETP